MTATGTIVAFRVQVIDGEGMPLAGIDLGVRYRYAGSPTTWSRSTTDGDGYAHFADEHPEPPEQGCFFVGEAYCDTWTEVADGGCYVLEM